MLKPTKRPFQRSSKSLRLEQIHVLSMDIERITGLRNKCFSSWTMHYSNAMMKEWEGYNLVIASLQQQILSLEKK